MDANVGWTFLFRLTSMFTGFLSLVCVAHFISPYEQGYYFTFASIAAMQTLFELGLTQILTQITSHEFPFLEKTTNKTLIRENIHGRRLGYFANFAILWYRVISLVFVVCVVPFGLIYFASYGALGLWQWAPPWIALICLTGINLYLSPRLAFIDGAGFPGKTAALRFAQAIIGCLLLVGILAAGCGLWAIIALPLTQAVVTFFWLRRSDVIIDFFKPDMRVPHGEPGWRNEVFSLQWRIALSAVGGYLAYLVFAPLLFANQGAVASGRWGLTFTLFSQLIILGVAWTSAKGPLFGELIARGDRARLDREFKSSAIKSTILTALACSALVAVIATANYLNLPVVQRVVSPRTAAFVGAGATISALIMCFATYIRAHKEEPLVISSLFVGSATAVGAYFGSRIDLDHVALAYLGANLLINLPWTYAIYRSYRKRTGRPRGAHQLPADVATLHTAASN